MSESSAKAFITDPAGSTSAADVRDAIGTIYTDLTNVGNLWVMSKTSSQTLTNGTNTAITFDRADIDGGGSVIDLANDRFIAPATGLYVGFSVWLWEGTGPTVSAWQQALVDGANHSALIRISAGASGNGGANGSHALTLTASAAVTLVINPGAVTGVTARGEANRHVSTSFALLRVT